MATSTQPPTITEGADIDSELQTAPKSAEDRKAAAAMATLDASASADDDAAGPVDQEAMSKAMGGIGGTRVGTAGLKKGVVVTKKAVKIDGRDLALVMDELDMTKPKATELLKSHDGNPVEAMRTVITNPFANYH